MKIGIGLDTGGTYTDAVIYDFERGAILGSAKALTTKEDLSIGILNAIDKLPQELLTQAKLISLSTTLATNACVEEKGGRAKLFFFGGEPKVLAEYGEKYGLPPVSDIDIWESYTTFSGKTEREPDWEQFQESAKKGLEDFDGVAVVETNAMKNGAAVEKKAKSILQKQAHVPVMCGHELFSELNSLQRASSTLLNVRLFPVIQEFLDAIQKAMSQRGIHAMVVIVRSDGSLMSEDCASVRPVETLLCGPAASVIGGAYLAQEPNSIVVDMGGTTTDIALVRQHHPVTAVDGVHIGRWRTFVNGLYVKTFGLGGDSAIHYREGKLLLEEYRVIPLCVAAQTYPSILENLKKLKDTGKHTKYLHEHYLLIREIEGLSRYTEEEQRFCRALKNGPLSLREAPAAVGKDMYNFHIPRLLREGVVQLCGLTPTDIMHIKGDFSSYCSEASLLAAEFVASNLEMSVEDLCEAVYSQVKKKIYQNVVKALLENQDPLYLKNGIGEEVERFIDNSYYMAQSGNQLLSTSFRTDFPLVGIGAPIKLFLEDVAKMLGTRAILCQHFEVANALGAIIGNVSASYTVEIQPDSSAEGITGYSVFSDRGRQTFKTKEEAEAFAVSEAEALAKEEAIRRGAHGEIAVTSSLSDQEAPTRDHPLYLGTSAVAHAVGVVQFPQS